MPLTHFLHFDVQLKNLIVEQDQKNITNCDPRGYTDEEILSGMGQQAYLEEQI